MSRTETVTCDSCGADLTSTGNAEGYRLALLVQSVPPRSGMVTARHVLPPLDGDYYFCNCLCLGTWMGEQRWGSPGRE